MKKFIIPALCICVLALPACVTTRASTAQAAKTQLTGMSKEEILTCMGAPENKASEGKTEVWTYSSGGGTDSFGTRFSRAAASARRIGNTASASGVGYGLGSMITRNRSCTVNVVFQGGRVTAVNYSGRTGGLLTQGEQCAYAVENCMAQP